MSVNILAFPIVGSVNDGFCTWMTLRDQTSHFVEFERVEIKGTRRIFLHVLYLTVTSEDDLFGTCAVENKAKTLSSRKADAEGY